MPSVGRRFADAAAKARGRYAQRYEIEIIPFFVGECCSTGKQRD